MARRLAAILAADVVGYSALMAEDEGATHAALKAHRDSLFDPVIARHGGRVVKMMGDGTLVEFASVVDAVASAVAIQSAMADDPGRLKLRIGINLGDVISDGDDIYGEGVNVAARLEALAEPGGICISSIVRESVGNRIEAKFADAGEHQLKGVAQPIRIWRWPAEGAASPAGAPLALPDKPSIAVLPFANMSGDPEQAYFSDGLTEDIITELSRFRSLFVIARNSAFVYRDRAVDLRQVGRELGVRYVVEGSVRRAGNRVRITVQLIEAATGNHVWAERYDRDLDDIFAVQDEITGIIAATLSDRLDSAEGEARRRRPPQNPTAYDHLLRGLDAYFRFTKEGNAEARRWYKRAIEADPQLSTGYHRLAWTYLIDFELGWHGAASERVAKARAAAERAVDLDPANGGAELALAFACTYALDWEGGEVHARRALKLNPSDAEIVVLRGYLDTCFGDPESGLDLIDRAMRLNPFAPDYYHWVRGITLYVLGRDAEALAAFREMANVPTVARAKIAACLARMGRVDEAKAEMAAFLRAAAAEHADYPGEDATLWRAYFSHSLPSREPAQLDAWIEGFRLAGLPG